MNEEKWKKSGEIKLALRVILEQCVCEMRICQKIYSIVTITENLYYFTYFDHSIYNNTKLLLTFIISLIRENLSKIFLTSLDRIYLLWRVTRVDRDIWNHKILHELLNLISLTNKGSHLVIFFRTVNPHIRPGGITFFISFLFIRSLYEDIQYLKMFKTF